MACVHLLFVALACLSVIAPQVTGSLTFTSPEGCEATIGAVPCVASTTVTLPGLVGVEEPSNGWSINPYTTGPKGPSVPTSLRHLATTSTQADSMTMTPTSSTTSVTYYSTKTISISWVGQNIQHGYSATTTASFDSSTTVTPTSASVPDGTDLCAFQSNNPLSPCDPFGLIQQSPFSGASLGKDNSIGNAIVGFKRLVKGSYDKGSTMVEMAKVKVIDRPLDWASSYVCKFKGCPMLFDPAGGGELRADGNLAHQSPKD